MGHSSLIRHSSFVIRHWLPLLWACAAAGGEEPAPGTARIAGKISPPGKVLKVGVVERIPATLMALHDQTHWGRFDPKTGEYAVEGLPAEEVVEGVRKPKRYDLLIETPEGLIEGVWLYVRDEEKQPTYDWNLATGQLATARFDASQYFEEGQVVSPEERDKVARRKLRLDKLEDRVKKVLGVASFNDTRRILFVHGTPERARVLVELMRKTAFYAEKADEVIWRIESWFFEWQYDVWNKPKGGMQVWQRKRLPAGQFGQLGHVFAPALGGIEVKAGETTAFDYALPEKFADNPGRLKGQDASPPPEAKPEARKAE